MTTVVQERNILVKLATEVGHSIHLLCVLLIFTMLEIAIASSVTKGSVICVLKIETSLCIHLFDPSYCNLEVNL